MENWNTTMSVHIKVYLNSVKQILATSILDRTAQSRDYLDRYPVVSTTSRCDTRSFRYFLVVSTPQKKFFFFQKLVV